MMAAFCGPSQTPRMLSTDPQANPARERARHGAKTADHAHDEGFSQQRLGQARRERKHYRDQAPAAPAISAPMPNVVAYTLRGLIPINRAASRSIRTATMARPRREARINM